MANKNYHNQIHHILTQCKPTRIQIAKTLGIGRQTLSDWEYQRTKVREHMVEAVAAAAGYSMDKMPPNLIQRDLDNLLRAGKPKEEPRIPKNPTSQRPKKMFQGLEVELNYGKPTERNKNIQTFINVTPNSRKIFDNGVEIPSDADLPDLITIALKGVGLYDAIYVPRHKIPRVTESTGAITLAPNWYYKSASGQVHRRMTQDAALAHIEELRQDDDLSASGLL